MRLYPQWEAGWLGQKLWGWVIGRRKKAALQKRIQALKEKYHKAGAC